MTKAQIRNIHVAKSKVGMSELYYRSLLRVVAGVDTCKDLTPISYEDCMAVMEGLGYQQFDVEHGTSLAPDYWRRIVARRKEFAGGRILHKITQLFAQYQNANPDGYALAQLTLRASDSRTERLEQLTPIEALNLIEMLKDIVARKVVPTPSSASLAPSPEATP